MADLNLTGQTRSGHQAVRCAREDFSARLQGMKTAPVLLCLAMVLLTPPAQAEDPKVPAGSGDYSKMLALAVRYHHGKLTFAQLTAEVVKAKLPPHPLRDGYLMMVPPPPPPGVEVDLRSMPKDWEKTFGEVAMMMFGGPLKREEYEQLHKAAHGGFPGFPNCGQPPK